MDDEVPAANRQPAHNTNANPDDRRPPSNFEQDPSSTNQVLESQAKADEAAQAKQQQA